MEVLSVAKASASHIDRKGLRDDAPAREGQEARPEISWSLARLGRGRGARPRWLVAAIKGGKKVDDFLIRKSPQNGRKKRRSKR
jgi:DNA-binding protein H-NS